MTDADQVWRDYVVDGDPTSGIHNPVKSEIRGLFAGIDNDFEEIVSGQSWSPISLQSFGAAGDGVTDDKAAIVAAIATGVPLTGGGLTYGVSGYISLASNTWIENARFKQLAPATSNEVRTLYAEAVNRTTLINVSVDRNGNGTMGQTSGGGAAGIYLVGGYGHNWRDVEVTGSDRGTGISLRDAVNSVFTNLSAHDMFYDAPAATDDTLQGILFGGLRNCRMSGFRAWNLMGNPSTLGVTGANNAGHYYGTLGVGTAIASATASTVTLASDASAVDDYYNGHQLYVVSGPGIGQCSTITDYVGASRKCILGAAAWVTATVYAVGALVENGTWIYKCITAHTSAAVFATDVAKWRAIQAAPYEVALTATSKVIIRSTRYTRGIVGSGTDGACILSDFLVSFADQGVDITGGTIGHPGLQIHDGIVSDINCWGIKTANIQSRVAVSNIEAVRVGNASFVVSPTIPGVALSTHDIDIDGCTSRDVGYGTLWNPTATSDIRVLGNDVDAFPNGVNVRGLKNSNEMGSKAYCFLNTVTVYDALHPNIISDCEFNDYATDAIVGFWSYNRVAHNLLINGEFAINQRLVTAPADGAYVHDRWHVLTQSNPITVGTQLNYEDGQSTSFFMQQANAVAQRMGVAQIIENREVLKLRNEAVVFAGRARTVAGVTVRYAILQWAGTADAVTKDVVLDWTSTTYTPGNFFIATVTVLATGSLSATDSTWRDLPDSVGVIGATANNLVVFLWTEGAAAQNTTVYLGLMQLLGGALATGAYQRRPYVEDLERCQRFYEKSFAMATAPATGVGGSAPGRSLGIASVSGANTGVGATVFFATAKRAAPTMTYYNPVNANAQGYNANDSVDLASTATFYTTEKSFVWVAQGNAGNTIGDNWVVQWTASAEIGI